MGWGEDVETGRLLSSYKLHFLRKSDRLVRIRRYQSRCLGPTCTVHTDKAAAADRQFLQDEPRNMLALEVKGVNAGLPDEVVEVPPSTHWA